MSSRARSVRARTASAGAARPAPAASRVTPRAATIAVSSRVAAGSRASSSGEMSASAAATASRKLIASWISNASVTRVPSTPRSYSIGTSRRKRSSWPARRACSAGSSGAARKPSSSARRRRPQPRPSRLRAERRRLLQPVERALELRGRRVAALAPVARLDDRRVPARERRFFREPRREAAPGRSHGVVEGGSQLGLVGVEQIVCESTALPLAAVPCRARGRRRRAWRRSRRG